MAPVQNPDTARTYRWDLTRGSLYGVIEIVWSTFALLIAIRVFQAPETVKPIVPAAISLGFLLTPLSLWYGSRFNWRAANAAAFHYMAGGLAYLAAALAGGLTAFMAATVASFVIFSQVAPLHTQIYSQNYPASERGSRFSTALLLTALSSSGCAWLAGRLLDFDLNLWRLVLIAGAVAAFLCAFTMLRVPSAQLERISLNHFEHLGLAIKDKLFGQMLTGWMFMGIGNLMTMPLRIEYIANPVYGVAATNAQVALMTVTIPQLLRVLTIKPWGWIFDRTNLVAMRIVINCLFLSSTILYFLSRDILVIGFASVLLGIAFGGAGIIWPLWVTKVAPEGKISAYMSVHTSLTGLRGVIAPFIGYLVITQLSPMAAALIGAAMIGISILIFVPARKTMHTHGRKNEA